MVGLFKVVARFQVLPRLFHSFHLSIGKSVLLLLAAIFFKSPCLKAQTNPQDFFYPVQFDQFENSYPFTNPGYIGQNGPLGINLGSQFTGNTGGQVATFFSTLSFRVQNEKKGNPQFIGLTVYNDQQGPKISSTRLYGMYDITIALEDSLTLTGGLAGGGFAYTIEPTSGPVATAGNTALAPDAKAGLWLQANEAYLGISLNQAFNNNLTPFRVPIQLERHFNFSAGKTVNINKELAIRGAGNLRTGPHIEMQGILSAKIEIGQNLAAGFAYQVNRAQIIPQIDLKRIQIGKHHLRAAASYKVAAPWSRRLSDLRALGLSIHYKMPNL